MESITWSEQEIKTEFSDCNNLKEVIHSLESRFSEKGEVICGLIVNGMPFSEEDEVKFAESSLGEISELSISTSSPKALVEDSLRSLVDFIPQIKSMALKASEAFRLEAEDVGRNKLFSDIMDPCFWLTEGLTALKPQLLKGHLEFDQNWRQTEANFLLVVKELLEAFEKKDWVLISDVIEYDLTTILDKWLELLSKRT